MALIEIPLTLGNPYYSFTVDMDNKTLEFTLKFNTVTKVWSFDIVDLVNNQILVLGQAVTLGANLMGAFNWLSGSLFLVDNSNTGIDPDIDELGDRVIMIWDDGND